MGFRGQSVRELGLTEKERGLQDSVKRLCQFFIQEELPQDQAKNNCEKAITQKCLRDVFVPTSHS